LQSIFIVLPLPWVEAIMQPIEAMEMMSRSVKSFNQNWNRGSRIELLSMLISLGSCSAFLPKFGAQ